MYNSPIFIHQDDFPEIDELVLPMWLGISLRRGPPESSYIWAFAPTMSLTYCLAPKSAHM